MLSASRPPFVSFRLSRLEASLVRQKGTEPPGFGGGGRRAAVGGVGAVGLVVDAGGAGRRGGTISCCGRSGDSVVWTTGAPVVCAKRFCWAWTGIAPRLAMRGQPVGLISIVAMARLADEAVGVDLVVDLRRPP